MGKVFCQICTKRCKGDVLKVHDKFIHKSCFLCCCCKSSLEKGGFFLKEERYYCKRDYLEKFGVKCKVCNEIAEGEVIVIFATTFHPNCFKCKNCFITFQRGDKVTLCNGEYLCYSCVFKQTYDIDNVKKVYENKPDEILTVKKENSIDELDTMTTSLISTIVSDSSENESATPEKRNVIERPTITTKRSSIGNTYFRHVDKDDNANSDSECLSIRTEPELSSYYKPSQIRSLKNFTYGGSISSLKPNQPTSQFGRFYNFSYLQLEENIKNQIHPNAIYKSSRSNISTSSSNIHHYHKIDNFSYRSSSNVTINRRPVRSHNLMKFINGKVSGAEGEGKDLTSLDEKTKQSLLLKKSVNVNDTPSVIENETSTRFLVDVGPKDLSKNIEIQIQNKSNFPIKAVRPTNVLDPISASRVPSASYEPLTRQRYEKHTFTSPSRNLTPQEIIEPISSSFKSITTDKSKENSSVLSLRPQLITTYKPNVAITRSQVIGSKSQDQDYISVQSFLRSFSKEKLSEDRKAKTYPYEALKISNFSLPKGVDRSNLEIYLSDEEFENIFKLSRVAFNRLPEWKRNDLKKRVDLF